MQHFLPHRTAGIQNPLMIFAFVLAVLVHIALFFLLQGFFKPKAYVVDQTSYRVSLNARSDDSQVMPNPEPVVKHPPQVTPKHKQEKAFKKPLPEPVKEISTVVEQPRLTPELPSVEQSQSDKPNENAATNSVEQVTSTKFKERRVSQAAPKAKKTSPKSSPSASEQTPPTTDETIKQPENAEPIKQEVAEDQQPAIQPVAEPVEKVREPQFQIGSPNNPKPTYPQRAINRGWEGDVVLGVHVDADGTVTYVEILESSNVSALDFAAYSTVMDSWRFSPADEDERALRGYVTVPISFRIN